MGLHGGHGRAKRAVFKEVAEAAEVFQRRLKVVCNALARNNPMFGQNDPARRSEDWKPLGEVSEDSKDYDPQSPFSAIAWILIHNHQGKTRIRGGK